MSASRTDRLADELLDAYRRYVGEPDRVADVYVGFGLFFGGVTLGVLAVVVFGWSTTVPMSAFHMQLRETAGALGLVGLPAFLLSVPVLLPADRRGTYAAALGGLVCLGGVGVFVASYPHHWNVTGTTDNSTLGVFVYAVGLMLLVGAGGAGLVAARVERARLAGEGGPASASGGGAGGGASEDVSAEQVERDIEEAMSNSELSWGGVEKTETTRLKIDTGDDDVDRSNLTTENANVSRSESTDSAVSGLKKLRGNESNEATGAGADDQVAALKELRERQAAEAAESDDGGVIERVRGLFDR